MQSTTIKWHGDEITEAIREAAIRGLLIGAEHLLAESSKLVPIDEATLERSGTATVDADKAQAAVSYDTPYAVRQHEDMTARHAPGRQAKYLEQPMDDSDVRNAIMALIAAQVRRAAR